MSDNKNDDDFEDFDDFDEFDEFDDDDDPLFSEETDAPVKSEPADSQNVAVEDAELEDDFDPAGDFDDDDDDEWGDFDEEETSFDDDESNDGDAASKPSLAGTGTKPAYMRFLVPGLVGAVLLGGVFIYLTSGSDSSNSADMNGSELPGVETSQQAQNNQNSDSSGQTGLPTMAVQDDGDETMDPFSGFSNDTLPPMPAAIAAPDNSGTIEDPASAGSDPMASPADLPGRIGRNSPENIFADAGDGPIENASETLSDDADVLTPFPSLEPPPSLQGDEDIQVIPATISGERATNTPSDRRPPNQPDVLMADQNRTAPPASSADTSRGSQELSGRNTAQDAASAARIEELETRLEQMESRFRARIDELEGVIERKDSQIAGLQDQVSQQIQKQKSTTTNLVPSASPSPKGTKTETSADTQQKPSSASASNSAPNSGSPAATTTRRAAPSSSTSSRIEWTLRSAQPGKAGLSAKNSRDIVFVEIGSTLPGLGTIQSISMEGGRWVVRGSGGIVRQ